MSPQDDVLLAARLVFGHRATQMPQGESDTPEEQEAPPPEEQNQDEVRPLEDQVLEAAAAAIPAGLLRMLQDQAHAMRSRESGKAGEEQSKGLRGRPIGSRRGDLRSRARLDLLDTLRAAAPWQRLRRGPDGEERLRVRREDFRVKRFRDRQASTTIFVVDASGSTAMDRLGEAKGAVEMLLADCYVRRDEVALIAFRGASADLLLPATRSLTRAKRSLAALPGGGGTPLATGLAAAESLAEEVRRKGRTPTLVVITDGRANVGRDGMGGREKAHADAESAARAIGLRKLKAILIDNSPRPEPKARASPSAWARFTCRCRAWMPPCSTTPSVPMAAEAGPERGHERQPGFRKRRRGLAEPRVQPLCRGARPPLPRAGRGLRPLPAAAPWHGRLDPFLARAAAAARPALHHRRA